jgi:hypothetical protein
MVSNNSTPPGSSPAPATDAWYRVTEGAFAGQHGPGRAVEDVVNVHVQGVGEMAFSRDEAQSYTPSREERESWRIVNQLQASPAQCAQRSRDSSTRSAGRSQPARAARRGSTATGAAGASGAEPSPRRGRREGRTELADA